MMYGSSPLQCQFVIARIQSFESRFGSFDGGPPENARDGSDMT